MRRRPDSGTLRKPSQQRTTYPRAESGASLPRENAWQIPDSPRSQGSAPRAKSAKVGIEPAYAARKHANASLPLENAWQPDDFDPKSGDCGPAPRTPDIKKALINQGFVWRPGSELNRRTRLCRPLHNHSATRPVCSNRGSDAPIRQDPAFGACRDFGAGNETRTRDLNLGKVALYQLSYSRVRPVCYRKTRNHASIFTLKTRFSAACKAFRPCGPPLPAGEKNRAHAGVRLKLERETRLELATSTLARLRSTN